MSDETTPRRPKRARPAERARIATLAVSVGGVAGLAGGLALGTHTPATSITASASAATPTTVSPLAVPDDGVYSDDPSSDGSPLGNSPSFGGSAVPSQTQSAGQIITRSRGS